MHLFSSKGKVDQLLRDMWESNVKIEKKRVISCDRDHEREKGESNFLWEREMGK